MVGETVLGAPTPRTGAQLVTGSGPSREAFTDGRHQQAASELRCGLEVGPGLRDRALALWFVDGGLGQLGQREVETKGRKAGRPPGRSLREGRGG